MTPSTFSVASPRQPEGTVGDLSLIRPPMCKLGGPAPGPPLRRMWPRAPLAPPTGGKSIESALRPVPASIGQHRVFDGYAPHAPTQEPPLTRRTQARRASSEGLGVQRSHHPAGQCGTPREASGLLPKVPLTRADGAQVAAAVNLTPRGTPKQRGLSPGMSFSQPLRRRTEDSDSGSATPDCTEWREGGRAATLPPRASSLQVGLPARPPQQPPAWTEEGWASETENHLWSRAAASLDEEEAAPEPEVEEAMSSRCHDMLQQMQREKEEYENKTIRLLCSSLSRPVTPAVQKAIQGQSDSAVLELAMQPCDAEVWTFEAAPEETEAQQFEQLEPPIVEEVDQELTADDMSQGRIAAALLAAGLQPEPEVLVELARSSSRASSRGGGDWKSSSKQWAAQRLQRKKLKGLRSNAGTPCSEADRSCSSIGRAATIAGSMEAEGNVVSDEIAAS